MENENDKKLFSESSSLIDRIQSGQPLRKEVPENDYSESSKTIQKIVNGTPLQEVIDPESESLSESSQFIDGLENKPAVQDDKNYSESADLIYGLKAFKHASGLETSEELPLPEVREKPQGTVLLNRANSVSDKQYSDSSAFVSKVQGMNPVLETAGVLPLPSEAERIKPEGKKDKKVSKKKDTFDNSELRLVIKSEGQSSKAKQRASTTAKVVSMVFTYIFLIAVAILFLFPFYWMIITSFKTGDEIKAISTGGVQTFWPVNFVNNYANLTKRFNFGTYVTNTLIVGLFSTIGTLFTCIFSAFAFSRLQFKGKEAMFSLLLATMMIPGEMMVVTNYISVSNLGWVNGDRTGAYLAMIIPFMVSVFYIYLLRQNFMQIPNELYLAAKVDGKTDWQYLWKVMVPLAMPSLVTIFILKLMGSWNSYIWPNLVAGGHNEFKLVSNGLRDSFQTGTNFDEYGPQMAAVVCVTVPLLLLFVCFRKYIMRGVSRAGIKG